MRLDALGKQYEKGVLFRLGRVLGARESGLRVIIPFVDVLHRVSLRIIAMPIQSQGRDKVSVDVSAVAYFRVVDAVKSVVAIENVHAAINQIAQITLRKVVGQHTLDETLSETDRINLDICEILDVTTTEWGMEVTLVELKDIQLPDTMKRAMVRQAKAEREKRAKIINAEDESLAAAALGDASDTMMAHPLALQLRNLQSLVEIGVDKKHHRGVPRPLDEHHRRTRRLPRPRGHRREPTPTGHHRQQADARGRGRHNGAPDPTNSPRRRARLGTNTVRAPGTYEGEARMQKSSSTALAPQQLTPAPNTARGHRSHPCPADMSRRHAPVIDALTGRAARSAKRPTTPRRQAPSAPKAPSSPPL
jgi:hypothetical protein